MRADEHELRALRREYELLKRVINACSQAVMKIRESGRADVTHLDEAYSHLDKAHWRIWQADEDAKKKIAG